MKIRRVIVLAAALGLARASVLRAYHVTDIHIDPYYEEGVPSGDGCYCEAHASCPQGVGEQCVVGSPNASSAPAGPFGDSEGDCATPPSLWASALAFMASASGPAPDARFVFLTGDYGEAGNSYPCPADGDADTAREQVAWMIENASAAVRAALPNAKLFGCLGNHDAAPGDGYGNSSAMAYLYEALAADGAAYSADLDEAARATLREGGWYAQRVALDGAGGGDAPGQLVVVSLNVNALYQPAIVWGIAKNVARRR